MSQFRDALQLLLQAMAEQGFPPQSDPRATVAILMSETMRFRDKLQEAGLTLTVGDVREALDGLETAINGTPLPAHLTDIQRELVQIWRDRLMLFK